MAEVAAGRELIAIREEFQAATKPGKRTRKNPNPPRVPDRGAWTRWCDGPESGMTRRWIYRLIEAAEKFSAWEAAVKAGRGNPTALAQASKMLDAINRGGQATIKALCQLPSPALADPNVASFVNSVHKDSPSGGDLGSETRAARDSRLAQIRSTLAMTPLALRDRDLKELAADEADGLIVAEALAEEVYGQQAPQSPERPSDATSPPRQPWGDLAPDLATARAVANLEPDHANRLLATPLARRKRDVQALGMVAYQTDYVGDLLEIVECGAADTLRGAQDVRAAGQWQRTTDRAGTWIPPRLRWLMLNLPDIARAAEGAARELRRAVKRGVERIEAAAGDELVTGRELGREVGMVVCQGQIDDLDALIRQFVALIPDGICPACKADVDEAGVPVPCEDCGGQGWVNRARRQAAREEGEE